MYSVNGNLVNINGKHGKYDRTVRNVDVRYGRNANDNYKSYIRDLGNPNKSLPLEFECKYMPDGKFNKFALLGSAYEEFGQRTKVKTEDLNKQIECQGLSNYSADALDIDQDGYIDIAEYATNTLAQDILSSTDGYEINPNKVNGIINGKGEQKAFALNNKYIENDARNVFTQLHTHFHLAEAQEEFLADSNNLAR